MLRIILLALAALIVISTVMAVVALVVTVVTMLAFAVVVGVPIYLAGRYWLGHHRAGTPRMNPLERLQNLYIEGKIDLFEYEQRVAALLAVER